MEIEITPEKPRIPMLIRVLAVSMSLYQLFTGLFQLTAMNQRVTHVTFALVLIFLYYGFDQKKKQQISWHGYLLAAVALGLGAYVLCTWFTKVGACGMAPPWYELALGTIFLLLCIEASRRTLGWVFPIIAVTSMIYARFGEMLPGILAHKNYAFERIVGNMFITTDGVFGMLAGISATYIFLFILFGSMLRAAGGGEFFINISFALFGHVRGGPAKIAVVASSLFGMLSGSGTANVAGTGQITIPLMKRSGYKPHFAGAVEAVSSAGGLLMPPIMGSAVFIIMEVLGVGYLTIMKAAGLSAILYYTGLFLMIDIEAQKMGMRGLPKEELPSVRKTFKEGWYFIIPIFVLIFFLMYSKVSVTRAAFWATISIPLCSLLAGKERRMTLPKILEGLESGALTALPVIAILSLGGVVLGMITLTGLGLMMSSLLIKMSGGNLLILLFLTMIASIILGMGVPPVAAYIVLAILVVPALIKMGVYPMAAHLFVFYFSTVAGITPPMAPDAFVAAGIAEAPMMRTAVTACRLAIVIFIIPFMFVYNNALLLIGSPVQIIQVCVTSFLGVLAIACAVQNYLGGKLPVLLRLALLVIGLLLIDPGWKSDLIGIPVLALIFAVRIPNTLRRFTIGLFSSKPAV
ncbi:MAG: TRAP transporter permease [Desulfobacterales bacterium]|jgi:TRAP transporter 4TM/12TM fusion protein|nr:TRAP transporter permease [Desulfobacteraceae bacterium]MDD3992286.1 TRAP transporter permease [Desulfobacteraceae bacterium]MDY0310956.1 TRAP transporter permease [Desulfobacterales bacterium]